MKGLRSNVPAASLPLEQSLKDYRVPRESSLFWFLCISVAVFSCAALIGSLIPKKEQSSFVEVDLEGIENEPPPLGEPDAGAGLVQPTPEVPEMEEQADPTTPEATPEPEVQPPDPAPAFVVPEEKKSELKPEPPTEKPKAKPRVTSTQASIATGAAGSGIDGAKAGIHGSPVGVPGGRGGSQGDFVSTPSPQYDATALARHYEGRGMFSIVYEGGRIVSVSTSKSTGVPYLDAKTIAHVKARYRVKPGTSGTASLPIVWKIDSKSR